MDVAYDPFADEVLADPYPWYERLRDEAPCAYVATREPFDKAGGYAIQGKAAVFVQHLEGSYSGVMGLPLFETAEILARIGFPVL